MAERYAMALQSGNLRLRATRSDLDYVIAGGLSGSGLGPILYRLVNDWQRLDQKRPVVTRGELKQARVFESGVLAQALAESIVLAQSVAIRTRAKLSDRVLTILTEMTLSAFLDDRCPECHGARVTGVYGSLQPTCRSCKGSGKRQPVGRTDVEQTFASRLLMEMEQELQAHAARIAANMRVVDRAKRWVTEQAAGFAGA